VGQDPFEKQLFWVISTAAAVLTVVWCLVLGAKDAERISLALVTCFSAFLLGSLVGFVFTIFGDEVEPLGKIRDAMIALASGIAGISIAKIGNLRALIGSIQLFGTASDKSSWFTVLFVISYFVAGFYFMYLLRKLVLNPALAKSRIELERIEVSGKISSIAIEIEQTLPQSLLLGREYISEEVEDRGESTEELRSKLFSDAVKRFLDSCQRDLSSGASISPENVKRAAVLHYYRSYFETNDTDRDAQQGLALEWINRALLLDPLDILLQIKLADLFGMQDRYDEAISIFERLERDEDSPQYVQQWLGYFLLFEDGREEEAIRHSVEFHERFPNSGSSLFNASCGYAQLYTKELHQAHVEALPASENRKESLHLLEQSVRIEPDLRAAARRHSEPYDSFESLVSDIDFLRITAPVMTMSGK
jgi:tetratricopeptide (TPR) repeat protein